MRTIHVAALLDGVIQVARDHGRYLVPFLKGPPGCAKSALVRAAAMRNGIDFLDVRLSIKDTVDLSGVPRVDEANCTVFAPPGWLPKGGVGILFLDEYPQASQSMQNVGGQLIYDRRCGDYVLPEGWIVVLAGNRLVDRAGTTQTPQQVNNRCVHVDVEPSYTDWRVWAVENDIHPMILAFLDFREDESKHGRQPSVLCVPSKDEAAFPTLRTWEFASDVLLTGAPDIIRDEALIGTIGRGAGNELIGFVRTWENGIRLWSEALSDPANAPLPNTGAEYFALCSYLSRRVDYDTFDALVEYLSRFPSDEIATVCILDAGTRTPVIKEHPAYTKWTLAHAI